MLNFPKGNIGLSFGQRDDVNGPSNPVQDFFRDAPQERMTYHAFPGEFP